MDTYLGIQRIVDECVRKEKAMKLFVFLSAMILAVTALFFTAGMVEN